jgi:hypothetical protein
MYPDELKDGGNDFAEYCGCGRHLNLFLRNFCFAAKMGIIQSKI